MIRLHAEKNLVTVLEMETITSGSVNVYPVEFTFSAAWDGLRRTAVFRAGNKSASVLLDDTGACTVPWEVLTRYGVSLLAGVFGRDEAGTVVLPTIWVSLGVIQPGVRTCAQAQPPPSPPLWEQMLDGKGDALKYDGLDLSLMSGNRVLSSVKIAGGGGVAYRFGHGLKQEGLDVSVDAVSDFSGDNTLPMTAAGVQTVVGNIESLLETI